MTRMRVNGEDVVAVYDPQSTASQSEPWFVVHVPRYQLREYHWFSQHLSDQAVAGWDEVWPRKAVS